MGELGFFLLFCAYNKQQKLEVQRVESGPVGAPGGVRCRHVSEKARAQVVDASVVSDARPKQEFADTMAQSEKCKSRGASRPSGARNWTAP